MMRGYGRVEEDLDEYEDDLDDRYGDGDQYEDEEEEEDEEHEEEEETIPEEKLRYLDLRQKLKEQARSKMRKENGGNPKNSQDRNGLTPLGKFGSFFGPSRPVIADRVIQESKSLLETRHLAAKQSTSQTNGKKVAVASTSASKSGVTNRPPPSQSTQVKSKAQMIKQTRDFYSNLLSDDAEIPKPGGNPGSQKNLLPKTDARSAQVPAKSREPSSSSGRKVSNEYQQRRPSSGTSQQRPGQTAPPQKLASASRGNLASSDSRRNLDSDSRRNLGSDSRRNLDSDYRRNLDSDSRRNLDSRKQAQSNKQLSSSNGSGPVRSAPPKVLPPKKPLPIADRRGPVGAMERKSSMPMGSKASTLAKVPVSNGQRPPPVKSQTSVISKRVEDRRDIQRSRDGKILTKENIPAPKYQTMRPPPKQDPDLSNLGRDQHMKKQRPSGQLSVHKSGAANNKDPYNKKRRADEAFSDEEFDYRSVIRGMFGRPRHYNDVDDDDDDMCMEVGFDTIQREEMRSARIARKEDDEELVKIMEEERQEKLRKQAKLRKMQR